FLELCANGNMQVVNPTTPAQYFHVLRRQLHRRFRKPLVVMTPQSLLRHRSAGSGRPDFPDRAFHTVLDDVRVREPGEVRVLLLVSGKLYYALEDARAEQKQSAVAIVRLEQLYPFPHAELSQLLSRYPNAREVRWVQEEPANMG